MTKVQTTKLANGVEIPYVGLGTFRSGDAELKEAVKSAISVGYTSFDTAWIYQNEKAVAQGIKESGRKREEFFITSKLWNEFQGYDSTLKAFDVSMDLLGTDYVDLYLVHWPGKDKFVDTWKAFEKLYKEKRIRAIGVSNFLPHHLDVLLPNCEILPMVNQIEAHPYYMDYKTIKYCQDKNIQMEAWAPLGFGSNLLKEETMVRIAKAHGKTSAQVTLRFMIQNGIRVIPKSVHKERQQENLNVFDFELNEKEMQEIRALNTNKRLGDDPDTFLW
jgi:Aldo/keto reductases, related to diketogulonate reductase